MPAVCVSRSRIVIGRRAGTCVTTPRSLATATVVRANDGISVPARVDSASDPSSISCMNRGAGQRLRLRRDAEDRVGRHSAAGFLVGPAERLLVDDLAVLHHERDDAGDAVGVDISLQAAIDDGARAAIECERSWGLRGEGRAEQSDDGDRCSAHTARIVP